MNRWTHPFNTYVSRKDADGYIYKMTSPMWLVLLIYMLALLNVVLWGGIGFVVAIEKIVGVL
jgi:hypothetical protein